MVKAILFDFGGVILMHRQDLLPFTIKSLFPKNSQKALDVWEEYKIEHDAGSITSKGLLEKMKRATSSQRTIDELVAEWKKIYTREAKDVNASLLDMISKLRKNYKVYLFSDTTVFHDEINSKRNIYNKFDAVFKSFEEGVSKSGGEEAYHNVLKKIGQKPEDCIFIDDKEANIILSEKIGMKGLLYFDNNQLLRDFKKIGITI